MLVLKHMETHKELDTYLLVKVQLMVVVYFIMVMEFLHLQLEKLQILLDSIERIREQMRLYSPIQIIVMMYHLEVQFLHQVLAHRVD